MCVLDLVAVRIIIKSRIGIIPNYSREARITGEAHCLIQKLLPQLQPEQIQIVFTF